MSLIFIVYAIIPLIYYIKSIYRLLSCVYSRILCNQERSNMFSVRDLLQYMRYISRVFNFANFTFQKNIYTKTNNFYASHLIFDRFAKFYPRKIPYMVLHNCLTCVHLDPHLVLVALKVVQEDVLCLIVVLVIIRIMIFHCLHYLMVVLVCVHWIMMQWMSFVWQGGDVVSRGHTLPFINL